MKAEIRFRQITDELPPGWRPGVHWQVECYDGSGSLPFPLGIAWVSDFSADYSTCGAVLDFVLVADQYRREGVASLLVEACRNRWPEIYITEPISEAGAALLSSLRDRGVTIEH